MNQQMQQELKTFLDKSSERILARLSSEEISEIKNAVTSVVNEIVAASSVEEKQSLLNVRFGILNNTVLHLAAKFGEEEDVKKLLAEAANPQYADVRNDDYFTPLHLAATNGKIAVVNILISAGADKNAQASERKRQWTPIHYAAQFGHVEVVEALIRAGVDKEIKTGFGLTPLVVGAEFGQLKVVQFLLSIAADKNVQTVVDNQKMTALHYAVIGNFSDVVVALLNAKINAEKETTFGLTAIEFAAKNNLAEMVLLLMSYGVSRWDNALKIAQEVKAEDVVGQVKKYQKAKANLFNAGRLEAVSAALIRAVKEFKVGNLGEAKIVLEDGVTFNAYGILSLTHQFGLFTKVTKTFLEFADENGFAELTSELKKLSAMMAL